MYEYALRRLLAATVVLLLLTVVVFLMIHLMPGDALLVKLGETGRIPDDQMEVLRAEMGLDRPLLMQYLDWATNVLRGNLGESLVYEGQTVRGSILHALPVTLELAVLALTIGLGLGLSVGVLSSVSQGRLADYIARLVAIAGLSAPSFWLALMVIIYAAIWFDYHAVPKHESLWKDPFQNLRLYLIPAGILGLNLGAVLMRFTRSSMLEVLRQDYMRTASAKGLPARVRLVRHALRNGLIPVLTIIGNQSAFLLSGSVILEVVFGLPGVGRLTYQSILTRDYPMVQGTALFTGTMVVFMNLLVDLSYGVLDPRVRYR